MRRLQIGTPPERYDPEWMANLVKELQEFVDDLTAGTERYTVTTSASNNRTLDVDNPTLADLAEVLGTLIADLKTKVLS